MRDRLTLDWAKEWAPGECELSGAQEWLEKNLTEVYLLLANDRVGAELWSLRHALPALTHFLHHPACHQSLEQIHHLHLFHSRVHLDVEHSLMMFLNRFEDQLLVRREHLERLGKLALGLAYCRDYRLVNPC